MCTWGPQWATVCGTGTGPKLANKFLCIIDIPGRIRTLQGGFYASNRFTQRVLAAQRELQRTSPVASQPLGMNILLICA